jgi:hypothetical protein
MSAPRTPRRSLESYRKEAKRWLRRLRDGDPAARARLERALPGDNPAHPTLRDTQLALARELGYPGWDALRAALADAPLAPFLEKVAALLGAYRLGTPEAMERHYRLTWHRRAWEAMKRYVRLDLGRQAGDPDFEADLTEDDARTLIAREHAYRSWDELVEDVAARRPEGGPFTARPVEVLRGGNEGTEERGRHPERHSRDWRVTLDRLLGKDAIGLDAHGQMTDALLADVARLDHLTILVLGGSRAVTDEGVRHLARLPRLRHLNLSGTGVTDEGLPALADLPFLETLTLSGTAVTDGGSPALGSLDALRRVDLMGTRTGDGALKALAGKPHLADLRSGNGCTDRGLAVLKEYPALREWRGEETSLSLMAFDARPTHLMLRGRFTDLGVEALIGLDGLFSLNLDQADIGITARGLAHLSGLPRLARLAWPAADADMPVIAALPHLRHLSCQDTTATDDGWVALSRSRTLEQIWGRDTVNLSDRGFRALAGMATMTALAVGLRGVSDAGLAALPEMPALTELVPMGVPDPSYRHIGACQHLEVLTLMYCRETGDEATRHLVRLPRLRRYFASYTRITDVTPALLATIPTLEEVTLSGCAGVTDRGVAALAGLPRLRSVEVSGRGVTGPVRGMFAAGVRVFVA